MRISRKAPELVLATSENCPPCDVVKRFLEQFFGESETKIRLLTIDRESTDDLTLKNAPSPTIRVSDGEKRDFLNIPNINYDNLLRLCQKYDEKFIHLPRMEVVEYDVIIVGCGISGSSVAIAAGNRGLRTLCLDRSIMGGHLIMNKIKIAHPLFCEPIPSSMLTFILYNNALSLGVDFQFCSSVDYGTLADLKVTINGSKVLKSKNIVIAAGANFKHRIDYSIDKVHMWPYIDYRKLKKTIFMDLSDAPLSSKNGFELCVGLKSQKVKYPPFYEVIDSFDYEIRDRQLLVWKGEQLITDFDDLVIKDQMIPNSTGCNVAKDHDGFIIADSCHHTSKNGVYSIGSITTKQKATLSAHFHDAEKLVEIISQLI